MRSPAKARLVARRAARRFRGQASPARELGADAAALVAEIAAGGRTRSLLARVDSVAAALQANGLQHDATILKLQAVRVSVVRGELDDARARMTTRAGRPVLTCHHPPAVARGAGRAGARPGRRPARPRPRARRTGRPARVAVLLRQPRPAEHAGRPRPRPRRAGARARHRARRSRPGLRVVRARANARGPGGSRPAADRRAGGPRPHRAASAPGRAGRARALRRDAGSRSSVGASASAGGTPRARARSPSRPTSTSCGRP